MELTTDPTPAVKKALDALGTNRKATVYISPKLVVSVCWRHKTHTHKRSTRQEYVVKIGAPNYREVAFIAACKKAGEPFPVKKVQLQHWPTPRKKG